MTGSRAAGLVHTATRRLVQDDLDGFAAVSGDDNPIHVDPRFAATTPFEVPVAHGMHLYGLVRAQLRAVFGDVPQRAQELMFPAPTPVGATVIVHLEGEEVEHIEADLVRVATRVTHGEQVGLVGRATLGAPGRAPRDPPADAPSVRALDVSDHGHGSSWWATAVGRRASVRHRFTAADLGGYRSVTGDPVPGDQVPEPLVAGLFSRLLGVELPGRGSNYLKQQLTFHRLLAPGDEVTATVEITRIRPDRRLVDLTTRCVGADGEPVCSGAALVLAAGVEPAAAVG